MKWLRAIVVSGSVCASALASVASCGDEGDEPGRQSGADGSADSAAATTDAPVTSDGNAGGGDATPDAGDADRGDADASAPIIDASTDYEVDAACGLQVSEVTVPPPNHVAVDTPLAYLTNPPAGGPHYGVWAHFQEYGTAPADGYLVHSMEHGAVVLFYNCAVIPSGGDGGTPADASTEEGGSPGDAAAGDASPSADADTDAGPDTADASAEATPACDALVQGLRDVRDSAPADPLCSGITPVTRNRIIIAPRPSLDVPVAASAWGVIYRASCFDPSTLLQFVTEHYAKAPEDFCAAGATTF